MRSNTHLSEPKQNAHDASVFRGMPLLRWLCISVLALALVASLVGPCLYNHDVDRDLERVERLVNGDWHSLIDGHRAPLFGQTVGGLFFLILAPFYIISSNTAWLYGVIAALIFLSVIPLWYLTRRICGSTIAWIACTVYAISYGRVSHGNMGYHCYMSLLPVMLFHLVLLRVAARPTIQNVIGALLLCLASLSLHLSGLPLLLIAPLVVLIYRWPLLTPRARKTCKVALVLAVVAMLGYGLRNLPARVEHYGQKQALQRALSRQQALQRALSRLTNSVWAIEDVVSLHINDHVFSPPQKPWPGDNTPRVIPPILLLIGLVTLLRRPPDLLLGRLGIPCGQAFRLARIWILLSAFLQLLIAGVFVDEWGRWSNWEQYRQIIPAVGPLQILMAIGVVRLALLVRKGRSPAVAVIAILLLLVAGHVYSITRLYSRHPSRLARYPISQDQFTVLAGLSNRWAIGQEWLTSCSYTELDATRLSPYLIRKWYEANESQGTRPLRLGQVLILAKSGSTIDKALQAEPQGILDTERSGDIVGRICTLSATRSLTLKHLVVPFSYVDLDRVRKGDRSTLCQESPPVLERDVHVADHAFPLIIANSPLPPFLYKYGVFEVDVVAEQTNHDLAIWFLVGRSHFWSSDDEWTDMVTATVVWVDGHRSIIRSSPPPLGQDKIITGHASFEGRAGADIEDIILSVARYLNPNHYQIPEGFSWSVISGKIVREPKEQPLRASVRP